MPVSLADVSSQVPDFDFDPEDAATKKTAPLLPPGLACCGDYLSAGSLETAMASGVAAARRVLA